MRLGLIGFGNIASTLVGLLAKQGDVHLDQLSLLVKVNRRAEIETYIADTWPDIARSISIVSDTADLLEDDLDLVVECAGHDAVVSYVVPVLRAGVDTILVSIGAMADSSLEAALKQAAKDGGAQLILPAGAVGGIDLLAALSGAGNLTVEYRGTKPPAAWTGTPAASAFDLPKLTQPTVIFSGSAREAASAYPKNANVAATLALAGAGFEATRVELIADPAAGGNIHDYSVACDLARYSIRIENLPSSGNVKTSVATVYSVLREIRNRVCPVVI